ncbi:MAG: hypothetical protein ACOCQD_00595 [archaeon]
MSSGTQLIIEAWEIGVGAGIFITWTAICLGIIYWLLKRLVQDLYKRLDSIQEQSTCDRDRLQKLELDVTRLENKYVGRDEHTKCINNLSNKIDNLHEKIDKFISLFVNVGQ